MSNPNQNPDNSIPFPGGQRPAPGQPGQAIPPCPRGCTRHVCQIMFADKQAVGMIIDMPNYALALCALAASIANFPNKSGVIGISVQVEISPIIKPFGH